MRTYYQRNLYCNKCKESMRQTVYNLPLNRIGLKMETMWLQDFLRADRCGAGYSYTDWRLVSDRDYQYNIQRAGMDRNQKGNKTA